MATVLVVDDSGLERHKVGSFLERPPEPDDADLPEQLTVVYATDGHQALAAMALDLPDLVLTDMQMPGMSGLQLVEEVRARYPTVPVVIITAHGSEESAITALQRGAASYVPKRHMAQDLRPTVGRILATAHAARQQQRVIDCLVQTEHRFVLENDIALIQPLVNFLRDNLTRMKLCDEADAMRVTVALHEALANAIEHGNLGVSSDLRESDKPAYRRMVEERRGQPPYRDRRVRLTARESRSEVVYIIQDEGEGFVPGELPDPTDPANLERVSGRGLLLIRTFMDEVRHNSTGNEITMTKRRVG